MQVARILAASAASVVAFSPGAISRSMKACIGVCRHTSRTTRSPVRRVFQSFSVARKFWRMRSGFFGSGETSSSRPRLSGRSTTARQEKCHSAGRQFSGDALAVEIGARQRQYDPVEAHCMKSRPEVALPDVQLIFNAAPLTATAYVWPFRRPYADAFACRAVVLRPESRGRLELVSPDPKKPLRIRQNFLATENDWKTLRTGLRIVRDVCRQTPMQAFMEREIAPGENATTDAALEAHIRATCITVHHPLGTCKMGVASDSMAVVDAELRVHGTQGLRIVDGSVMPDLVGANINAPIIMIAEKAADLIRGRQLLEPARMAAVEHARQ